MTCKATCPRAVAAAATPRSLFVHFGLSANLCAAWTRHTQQAAKGDKLAKKQLQMVCHPFSGFVQSSRCTPPPAVELEGSYELIGEPGKKNGEKACAHFMGLLSYQELPAVFRQLVASSFARRGSATS